MMNNARAALLLTLAALSLGGGAHAQSARNREEKAQSKPTRSESNDDRRDNRTEVYQTIVTGVPVIVGGGGGGGVYSPGLPRYGGARFGNNPRLAFVSDQNGLPTACIVWEYGSTRETISPAGLAVRDVAFSPYRGRIACAVSSRGGQVLLLNANGRKPKTLNIDGAAQGIHWSPDDQWLVYSSVKDGSRELYAATADGKTVRRLTDNPANDTDPVFSGDGQWVYFTSDRDGKPAIYRLRWDGGATERVTSMGPLSFSQPACPPWSNYIAYVGEDPADKTHSDIYLLDVTTQKVFQLTRNAGRNVTPTFSPDGARIAFSSSRNGLYSIFVIPYQGGDARQMTFGPGNDTHPSWW